jgi:hypothetical protein
MASKNRSLALRLAFRPFSLAISRQASGYSPSRGSRSSKLKVFELADDALVVESDRCHHE